MEDYGNQEHIIQKDDVTTRFHHHSGNFILTLCKDDVIGLV